MRIISAANVGILSVIVLLTVASCCNKNETPSPTLKPISDKQDVRLRELSIQNSPTPYYGFTYDDSGYVTSLNFASGLCIYFYFYKNGRIDSARTSLPDSTYLLYRYTGDQVSSVLEYGLTGLRQTTFIRYDNKGRVSRMEWRPISTTLFEKTKEFTYYDNGNLSRMTSTYPATGNTSIVAFEAYDDKRSVDGFDVYKEFFDHMIFLPTVRFQINNPTRMKLITGINERMVQQSYVYRDSLPLERNAAMQVTAGPSSGQSLTSRTTFSYY